MGRMESRLTGDVRPQLRVIEGAGRESSRRREVLEQFSRPDSSHRSSHRRRMEVLEDDFERGADRFAPTPASFRRACDEVFAIAGGVRRRSTAQTRSARKP